MACFRHNHRIRRYREGTTGSTLKVFAKISISKPVEGVPRADLNNKLGNLQTRFGSLLACRGHSLGSETGLVNTLIAIGSVGLAVLELFDSSRQSQKRPGTLYPVRAATTYRNTEESSTGARRDSVALC